jgi:hypothetical protein
MQFIANDLQGSGSLEYLRPELFTAKEVRIIMPEWTPYVALSNTVTVPAKLTMVVPADLLEGEFEARQNLQTIRTNIRSAGGLVEPDDIRVADDALRRLSARADEPINDWAENLSRDISARDD